MIRHARNVLLKIPVREEGGSWARLDCCQIVIQIWPWVKEREEVRRAEWKHGRLQYSSKESLVRLSKTPQANISLHSSPQSPRHGSALISPRTQLLSESSPQKAWCLCEHSSVFQRAEAEAFAQSVYVVGNLRACPLSHHNPEIRLWFIPQNKVHKWLRLSSNIFVPKG